MSKFVLKNTSIEDFGNKYYVSKEMFYLNGKNKSKYMFFVDKNHLVDDIVDWFDDNIDEYEVHNNNEPSIIEFYPSGNKKTESFYENNILIKKNFYYDDYEKIEKEVFFALIEDNNFCFEISELNSGIKEEIYSLFHNTKGPAYIKYNKSGKIIKSVYVVYDEDFYDEDTGFSSKVFKNKKEFDKYMKLKNIK